MLLRCLKDVDLIQVPVKTSLRPVKLVSLTQVLVGLSLFKLVGSIYVPVRRCKNIASRSVLLTYQLRRRGDVSAWSRTSAKWVNFFWVLGSTFFQHLWWFSVIKVATSTLIQHLKDVRLLQVLVVTSLRCVKLVSLNQVSIGTSLQRLKLVGFIYVPMRRRKDVTNTSHSRTSCDVMMTSQHGPRRLDLFET